MARTIAQTRWTWLVLGLLGGVALVVLWPGKRGLATATDRRENFIMATGIVDVEDGGHEAVFLLDNQTGLLMATIINRQTGKFTETFRRVVANDFGVNPQQAHYMMVTGRAVFRAQPRARFALYVTELKSGQMIAYTFPWLGERPGAAVGNFIVLDGFRFRN